MRELYEKINETLNNINFNDLWPGFNRTDFALYSKTNVYLKDRIIPYNNRFVGDTVIYYEDSYLAIWEIDDINNLDYKELSANIVHEMFHAFQLSHKEFEFPDDIEALSYPQKSENYNLKYNENMMIVKALNSNTKNEKIDFLKKIIASRKLRLKKFGSLIKYEFVIETIECSAEYCGTKALKFLSNDLYKKRIDNYKYRLTSDIKGLFYIRRNCYFNGTLFLLLLHEIGIDYSKNILNEKSTIFEYIAELFDNDNTILKVPHLNVINKYYTEEVTRKQTLINDFKSKNPKLYEGEFTICRYDPMNMFKVNNEIYCSNFIKLENIISKESIFLNGPVILILRENTKIVNGYYVY